MRHQKTICLDPPTGIAPGNAGTSTIPGGRRAVIVRELQVRQARRIIAEAKTLDNVEIVTLLQDRFAEIGPLLDDCVQMPDGETLDDLSLSEVAPVIDGFMEVNAGFLALAGRLGLALEAVTPSPTSTEPAYDSSNEDTPA